MPQLAKGGKWVFGWCVVGPAGKVRLPPEACAEYGFQAGEPLVFLRGSWRSDGFSVGRLKNLTGQASLLLHHQIGAGVLDSHGCLAAPAEAPQRPGDRLLAVRGSGYALLLLTGGPIYEEALKHPEIEIFMVA